MDIIKIGVITASDRASKGIYEDISGQEIQKVLGEYLLNPLEWYYQLVSDEQIEIENALVASVAANCALICTTGGTGPAVRDVTPEATESVCDKMLPGFGELMRAESLKYVPTAILSRQTAGIKNQSLIINLPGKPKSIRECLQAVFPAVPYCIDLIEGPFIVPNELNISVFRPKK